MEQSAATRRAGARSPPHPHPPPRAPQAVMHYGEALKAVTNEEFDDGIMSAIDFLCTVDRVKGAGGEDRVVITFNGEPLLVRLYGGLGAGAEC